VSRDAISRPWLHATRHNRPVELIEEFMRFYLGLLLALGVALALRCPQLDQRPMHNDEAVNAIKFRDLWERGIYKYDPNEHHGPTLFYATLAFSRLTRAPDFVHFSEIRLRLVTVAFGIGLILLLPLVTDGLGRNATAWAAGFTAVSPAMVFYSRYFIHEMLLVFFAFLALAAGWRFWRTRKMGWALIAGAGVGLMHATKETFVISLAAAVLALLLNTAWNRWLDAATMKVPRSPLGWKPFAAALGVWLVVALVLFSSFLLNAGGPLDSVRTYLPWLHRAAGESPHIHPWHFYLTRLVYFHAGKGPLWSEALILGLAIVGAVAAFRRKGLGDGNAGFVRFVALYSFTLLGVYSAIAYKTPWCLLNFWHGMILLAGVGAMVVVRGVKGQFAKAFASVLLFGGAAHLTWQAWQGSFAHCADPRNPYVYAQTSPNIRELVAKIEGLARVHPDGRRMLVKVMAPGSDYWPLPWELRAFSNVGWWNELPDDPFAPVMIVSSKFNAKLDQKGTHQMPHLFALRPQTFVEFYVEADLWRAYVEKNPPARE
jgi:uncharacterized protein (TIGR03663 family)